MLQRWDCTAILLSHFGGIDAQFLTNQAIPLQEDDKWLAESYTQF